MNITLPIPHVDYRHPAKGNSQALLFDERFGIQAMQFSFRCPKSVGGGAVNLLTGLLERGTASWPTLRDFARQTSSLYGMHRSWTCMRSGDGFLLVLSIAFASPSRVPDNGYYEQLWRLIDETIHQPALMQPDFPLSHFETDQRNYISYLRQLVQEPPARALFRAFPQVLVGDPMATPTVGSVLEVEALKLEGLQRLFARIVGNSNVCCASVGPVSVEDIAARLENLLGTTNRREGRKTRQFQVPDKRIEIRDDSIGEGDQLIVFFAPTKGIRVTRAEFSATCGVLSSGSQSRIYSTLREEKGLAYSHFDISSFEKRLFIVASSVLPGKGEEARAVVEGVIADVRENGIEDEELEIFRREAGNGLMRDLDSPRRLARMLTASLLRGREFNPERSWNNLCRVSTARLRDVAASLTSFADYVGSAALVDEPDSSDDSSSA